MYKYEIILRQTIIRKATVVVEADTIPQATQRALQKDPEHWTDESVQPVRVDRIYPIVNTDKPTNQ